MNMIDPTPPSYDQLQATVNKLMAERTALKEENRRFADRIADRIEAIADGSAPPLDDTSHMSMNERRKHLEDTKPHGTKTIEERQRIANESFGAPARVQGTTDGGHLIEIDNEAGTIAPVKGSDGKPITFDLTPRGAQTVEGRQRIAKAQDGLHDALHKCAEALRELVDTLSNDDVSVMHKDRARLHEALEEARVPLKGWTDAGEAFVRAVAGAPERGRK